MQIWWHRISRPQRPQDHDDIHPRVSARPCRVLRVPQCEQYVLSTGLSFSTDWICIIPSSMFELTAQRVENPYLTHIHAATCSHLRPFWDHDSLDYYFNVIPMFTKCESIWLSGCYQEKFEHNAIGCHFYNVIFAIIVAPLRLSYGRLLSYIFLLWWSWTMGYVSPDGLDIYIYSIKSCLHSVIFEHPLCWDAL